MAKRSIPPKILREPIRAYEFPETRKAELIDAEIRARFEAAHAFYGINPDDPASVEKLVIAALGVKVLHSPRGGAPKRSIPDRVLARRYLALHSGGKRKPAQQQILQELKAGKFDGLYDGPKKSKPTSIRAVSQAIDRGLMRHCELREQRLSEWGFIIERSLLSPRAGRFVLITNRARRLWLEALWERRSKSTRASGGLVKLVPLARARSR